VLLISG